MKLYIGSNIVTAAQALMEIAIVFIGSKALMEFNIMSFIVIRIFIVRFKH